MKSFSSMLDVGKLICNKIGQDVKVSFSSMLGVSFVV